MDQLDQQVDDLLEDFRSWFAQQLRGADRKTRRRMGGVGLLTNIGQKTLDDVPFQIDPGGRFRASSGTITISTDGALCNGNRQRKKERRPAGWAFVVHDRNVERAGYNLATTNNRMELTAVIEALRYTDPGASVIVRTDSQYVKNVRNNGSMVKQNGDLWKTFEDEAQNRRVKIVWVKGHAGDPNNERADKLAGQQADEVQLAEETDLIPDKA